MSEGGEVQTVQAILTDVLWLRTAGFGKTDRRLN